MSQPSMLSYQTVLLTGGAGFIGSHVAEALLKAGKEVICLDNFDPFYNPAVKHSNIAHCLQAPLFHLVEGDIRESKTLKDIFKNWKVDVVIHLAARAGVRNSLLDPQGYHDVNVNGTISLMEACRESQISHFLLASSSSVYGDSAPVPFKEDEAGDRPVSPYASSKRAAELIAYTYHHLYGIPITALRFFTVYGPRQRPEMAIHLFASLIDQGEPITIFGDGSSSRDYTFVEDIVCGVLSATERPDGFQVFNLGNSKMIRLIDLIESIEEVMGKQASKNFESMQPGDVTRTCADITRAGTLLGYDPKTSIKDGLVSFAKWFKDKNPS